ncbi:MAG: hypothetical protein K0R68_616 [Mycobacterium sp.]|jgi:hypothetical protein|nr:hypothetical protein [Mycobacterium sp.]
MDDMRLMAERLAEIARGVVNDSAGVAQEVFAKTNPPDGSTPGTFTAGDAINSMTRLVDIAVGAGVAMARVPLQTEPDRQTMLVADNVASVIGRGVTQASRLIADTTKDIEQNGFSRDRVAESTVRLAGLAMLRGAEIIQTVAAGPGMYRGPTLTSDEFTVAPDADHDRTLELVTLARPGVDEDIAHAVRFIPADRILLKGQSTFRLTANTAGIPSGIYQGTVTVSPTDDPGTGHEVEVLFAL